MGSSARVIELPRWAGSLLAGSRVGRLGLLDGDGAPRVMPVTYAISGESLVTAVDQKPKRRTGEDLARVRWLLARPAAALTVDHYDDDWSALAWVQALGTVRVLDAASAPDAMAALVRRYEPYRSDRRPARCWCSRPDRRRGGALSAHAKADPMSLGRYAVGAVSLVVGWRRWR